MTQKHFVSAFGRETPVLYISRIKLKLEFVYLINKYEFVLTLLIYKIKPIGTEPQYALHYGNCRTGFILR